MEVDFSQLDLATATKVDQLLRQDYNALLLEAAGRQRRIAFLNHLQRPFAKDGYGERTVMVDPVFDAFWREAYGKHYLDDPDLVKFLVKRNPEIGVQSRGTREICVGWMPSSHSKKPLGLTAKEKGFAETKDALLPVLGGTPKTTRETRVLQRDTGATTN